MFPTILAVTLALVASSSATARTEAELWEPGVIVHDKPQQDWDAVIGTCENILFVKVKQKPALASLPSPQVSRFRYSDRKQKRIQLRPTEGLPEIDASVSSAVDWVDLLKDAQTDEGRLKKTYALFFLPLASVCGDRTPPVRLARVVKNRLDEMEDTGVVASGFQWGSACLFKSQGNDQKAEYSFSVRNGLEKPVTDVHLEVAFFDQAGNPVHVDEVFEKGVIGPGLARRVTSVVDSSVKNLAACYLGDDIPRGRATSSDEAWDRLRGLIEKDSDVNIYTNVKIKVADFKTGGVVVFE